MAELLLEIPRQAFDWACCVSFEQGSAGEIEWESTARAGLGRITRG